MKQTVDGYDVPIYRNSLIHTYQTQTKGDFAWHLNFSRLDPAFDFQIIYREILSAADVLDAHIHENSAEVAFVLRGEQFFRIDDTDYRVLCGEMLIAPPASVHSSNHRIMPKGEIYNLTINPACIRALLPSDAAESADTLAALLCAPPKKIEFRDQNLLCSIMEELHSLYYNDISHRSLRIHAKIAQLLLFISDSVETVGIKEKETAFIDGVFSYIDQHISENMTVDKIARYFNYSPSVFASKFKKYTQYSVHEYILRKKIETAQTWMYNPQVQPQEIWRKLSFSSGKYFNEVFKRYTGLTVLQYYRSIHHNN